MAGSTVQISGKGTGGEPQNIQIGDHGDQMPHPKAFLDASTYVSVNNVVTPRYDAPDGEPIKYVYGHGQNGANFWISIIGIHLPTEYAEINGLQGLLPTRARWVHPISAATGDLTVY